jgi:hypothetical protein
MEGFGRAKHHSVKIYLFKIFELFRETFLIIWT